MKPGRDLTGREMIWVLFDYLKQANNRHSFTDYEDLASVKLHGKRLGKYWEAWKFVLRNITKQPASDVLEYLVWTQIQNCELIKDEGAIYSRKTKKGPSKKSYVTLKTIIEAYLERTRHDNNSAAHKQFIKQLGADGVCCARNACRGKRQRQGRR